MKTISPIAWIRKVAVALLATLCLAAPAWAGKYASIVIDMETGQVLHDREADELRHPASLTKVMTLYLVFDAIESGKLKLTDRLPVSKAASRAQPSKLGLKSGSTIKVEDAIRALVTKSANDVAIVIAEKLGGGSETKFVAKMNAKAKELGMLNTTFRNASGLPDKKQVTTARDMAKLAEAVYMDHKNRYNYFSLSSFSWGKRKYMNHNELLKRVAGVDGIKTGFTNASGYNLMASAERGGRRVIAIMMGGSTGRSRDAHVADLIEAAFLELGGAPAGDDDLRTRIAFGDRVSTTPSTADDLALAQLRRLQEPDAALVASLDDDSAYSDEGTTEDEIDAQEVAEGDSEPAEDPIGALIDASPATTSLEAASYGSTPVVGPSPDAIMVTSELGANPAPGALAPLALPVTATH